MNKIRIKPKLIVRYLTFIASFLIILGIVTQVINYTTEHHSLFGLIPFLNLDEELNLSTFFSGLILLFSSLLLAIIYFQKRKEKDRFYWATLSLGFLYMMFDEMFMIHERYVRPIMHKILEGDDLGIFNLEWLTWVIPFGIIVFILGFIFFRFWYNLPRKTRMLFFIAAVIFVGGAIGFELIEGIVVYKLGEDNLMVALTCSIQESLEIFGVIIFIKALLDYLSSNYKEFHINFDY